MRGLIDVFPINLSSQWVERVGCTLLPSLMRAYQRLHPRKHHRPTPQDTTSSFDGVEVRGN